MANHDSSALIDDLCDKFEVELRKQNAPTLNAYMERVPSELRAELLRELLALEFELLPHNQFHRRLELHVEDFPEYMSVFDEFLEENSEAGQGIQPAAGEESSRQVGPYKILQVIGEGGMGSVYMAEQESPVKRQVALKVIKAGLDSKQVIARFEAERQALAMMDHPAIARILDAGTTKNGQPFFAMELVKGVDINEYCDRHQLSIPQRLAIFQQVCEGVQHAHQKGIIHRDLKPSNILIAEYNGQPVPKIIDFGLAKALDVSESLTDKTMFTEFGQVLGTLKYMSPEQAGLDSLDIDTRSDIYTLGIILYELLTGTTPLDSDSMKDQAILSILELVREQDAPRPSNRLTTSKETLTAITKQRRIDPNKLTQILTGDLDWIVMKAIDKDRTRRYESAGAFAEDVQRYLDDKIIEARPPSQAYKVRKFVKKNRGLVVAAAAIATVLIAGVIGTSYGLLVAESARKDAVEETKKANKETELARSAKAKADLRTQKAEIAKKDAQRSRDFADKEAESSRWAANKAKSREEQALVEKKKAQVLANRNDAMLKIVIDSFQNTDPWQGADSELTATQVLKNVYTQIPNSQLDEAGRIQLLNVLSKSFRGLGEPDLAVNTSSDILEINRKNLGEENVATLLSKRDLAMLHDFAGNGTEALSLAKESLEGLRKALGNDAPDTILAINNLGVIYSSMGLLDNAVKSLEEAVERSKQINGEAHQDTLGHIVNLASLHSAKGDLDLALPLLKNSLALSREKLGEDHPQTLINWNALASLYRALGRLDESLIEFEQIYQIGQSKLGTDHPSTLAYMSNLSYAYLQKGRVSEALQLLEQATKIRREKLGDKHRESIQAINNLAVAYVSAGRVDQALQLSEEAVEIMKSSFGEQHPDTMNARNTLAVIYLEVNRVAEAIELLQKTLAFRRANLGENHPDSLSTLNNLAMAFQSDYQDEKAAALFEASLRLTREKLGEDHPQTLTAINNLANCYNLTGRYTEAIKLWENALPTMIAKLGKSNMTTLICMSNIALAKEKSGELKEALALHKEVFELTRAALGPDHPRTLRCMEYLGVSYQNCGKLEEAEQTLSQCLSIHQKIHDRSWQIPYLQILNGNLLMESGRIDEGFKMTKEGFAKLEQLGDSIPKQDRLSVLSTGLLGLIKYAELKDDSNEAAKWRKQLDELRKNFGK